MATKPAFAGHPGSLHVITLSFFYRSFRLFLSGSKAHISVAYDDYLSALVCILVQRSEALFSRGPKSILTQAVFHMSQVGVVSAGLALCWRYGEGGIE
jgi:hypothetical protein